MAAGPARAGEQRGFPARAALRDLLSGAVAAPYRRTFAREERDEDDFFTLVVLGEALGVPDPAAYFTAELLPALTPRFHRWHQRVGLPRSPLDHISCC